MSWSTPETEIIAKLFELDETPCAEAAQEKFDDNPGDRKTAVRDLAKFLEKRLHDVLWDVDWEQIAEGYIGQAEVDKQCEAASQRPENP